MLYSICASTIVCSVCFLIVPHYCLVECRNFALKKPLKFLYKVVGNVQNFCIIWHQEEVLHVFYTIFKSVAVRYVTMVY